MKYNRLVPNKIISRPINFLLILIYHLTYLLVNKFNNLSLNVKITILRNKNNISPVTKIDIINKTMLIK